MAGLFKAIGDRFATRRFFKSDLGQALSEHTRQFFNTGVALSWMSPESKERIVQALLDMLSGIQSSADPLGTLRSEIGGYAVAAARFSVLTQTEEEKAVMPYAANPYISGALHLFIKQAAVFDDELSAYLQEHSDVSAADLVDFANTRGTVMLYMLNGLNIIRRAMGDCDEKHDWFQAMYEAQLVKEEDTYRRKLGMPSLFAEPADVDVYGSFLAFVSDGEVPNPLLGWLQVFPGNYLAGYNATGALRGHWAGGSAQADG